MTQTSCSFAQSKQLHLFNIITLAEDKLQSNFSRILFRLNNHERQIQQNKTLFDSLLQKINNIAYNLQLKINTQIQQSNQLISASSEQIEKLNNQIDTLKPRVLKNEQNQNQLNRLHQSLRKFMDGECQARNVQNESTKQKIRNIELELNTYNKNIIKKQNTSQVNKIRDSISEVKQHLNKIIEQQKFVQFKLDKFQINNQKSQKNRLNKQITFMKELEEKMKNQFKLFISNIQKSYKNQSQPTILIERDANQKMSQTSASSNMIMNPYNQKEIANNSFIQFEQLAKQNSYMPVNSQISPKNQNKIYQSLNILERRFQIYDAQLKQMNQVFQNLIKNKKSNMVQFEQKINAVKPQLIKMQGKCDALQDKIIFLQKRAQQKSKQIAYILQVLKQAQSSKFEQKLKMFQTQIFSKLQQQKIKIESKVNNNEFQKFSKNITQKVQFLNDQVVLKCDKLEVKKALLFLQSKIKQVILIISEQEQNEKDALITKKQIKCISCDKDIDKFLGVASNLKGNWDAFPNKQHCPDVLGRFGMTNFGSLSRKLKRLDNKDIPIIINKRNKQSAHLQTKPYT